MAAAVFLPVFVVGQRVGAIQEGIAFPQRGGLIFEFGDGLAIYVLLLVPVILGVLMYLTILWPFCRWASISVLRVVAFLAAPVVALADLAIPRGSWFSAYPVGSAVATLLYGLGVGAGFPGLPVRIAAAVKRLVLVPPT